MPAEVVRRMLGAPDLGANGGTVHYVMRRRYLDGQTFTRLVRDSWVGSSGSATTLLLEALGLRPSDDRNGVTMAIDEPWGDGVDDQEQV